MNRTPTLPLLALLLVLTGCTATNPIAPAPVAPTPMASAPVAPTTASPAPEPTKPLPLPVIEAKPASIIGSEESSAMLDSFTAFVTAVDGVPVAAGRQGWNTPLAIKAGPRRLAVAFNRGVFSAHCELPLNVRSESVYQLKFATDAELFGKNSYCEFWVVDTTTNEPATKRTRVSLTKIEAAK